MRSTQVRMPAVAGRFYPSNPKTLGQAVDEYLSLEPPEDVRPAWGCVVPHAGYMYSGHVAGAVYRRIAPRRRAIILGPNHFARGHAPLAIVTGGHWRTPLGDAAIDRELAETLQSHCAGLADDREAHAGEHSLEVQIPFLQRWASDFSFVPIVIGAVEYETLADLGAKIALALRGLSPIPLIIASSDMNHYEPDGVTRVKDAKAIEKILALDPSGLYDVVMREGISMCGYAAVTAALVGIKQTGASSAVLARYATSADAGGDRSAVVGYAGIIFR